jgi:predicted DCC family thiol-disulfide oxidoreductase YuxK
VTTKLEKSPSQDLAVPPPEQPKSSLPRLPSPREFPNAEVVIYDGQCRFCTSQVARLHRWDGKGRLAFVSLDDPLVATRYRDLTREKLLEQMYVITRDQRRLGGAEAFRYLTTRLPRLWILAPLMHLPFSLPLWQYLYRQVARHRYLLAGKTGEACEGDTCRVHFEPKK